MYYPGRQIAEPVVAYLTPAEKGYVSRIGDALVSRGYDPETASAIVSRAASRVRSHGVGLGQAPDTTLASIIARAKEVQVKHQRLIDRLPSAATAEARLSIKNELYGLQSDWTRWALSTLGIEFPHQLDTTNPAHAVVASVRQDIRQTSDLLEAGRVAQAISRQIGRIKELEAGTIPGIPGVRLPDLPSPGDILGKLLVPVVVVVGGYVALKAAKVI